VLSESGIRNQEFHKEIKRMNKVGVADRSSVLVNPGTGIRSRRSVIVGVAPVGIDRY
jgi:hypothetical protein